MKKNRKEAGEFHELRKQISSIRDIVTHTKSGNLWSHEAAVRKKIKAMKQMQQETIKGFQNVYRAYEELFDEISRRLLEDYNQKNHTDYALEEVVKENKKEYLASGIIAVLVTNHIPKKVAEEFNRYFPDDPKNEYEDARRLERKIYLHLGETNTGKTYHAIERLKESKNGIYLAPLRILALEIFEKLNDSGVKCSLLTGEEEILVEGAHHQSSTVEKLNSDQEYEVAVIDEIQMIADSQRGAAWTRALLGLRCKEIHICGALNAKNLLVDIIKECGDLYEVKEYKRDMPLVIEERAFRFQETGKGDALIVFSKRRVLEIAKLFQEKGQKVSMIYGDLPPEVRKMQYHAFVEGERNVLVSTDAIGMGVNLPIRRIIFMNDRKFDGEEVRKLTSQEVKQIAGRAGRKGIYETGYVAGTEFMYSFLRQRIEMEDEALEEAVLGPSEALLKVKGLPLREKLALWSTREEQNPLYRKMDVRDYIFILDQIRRYRLEEIAEWRLMRLPFDVHDEMLLDCFLEYVEQYFIRKQDQLTMPKEEGEGLEELELYYRKVNLYYSFSKSFRIPFEEEWVYAERGRISEKINELLVRGAFRLTT
ncbi:MAG: RNA helicase [Lachnospiraceae bacterium]|nr:RNA helicase [Lachnospiraceae bacterium]